MTSAGAQHREGRDVTDTGLGRWPRTQSRAPSEHATGAWATQTAPVACKALEAARSGHRPPVLVAPFLWRPEALPGHPGFATCLALPAPAEVDDVTREERDMCARNQQGSSSRHVLGEIKVFRKLGRNKQCIFA